MAEAAVKFKTYVVRPKISSTDQDPVGGALAKHGMSKFAGCPDIIYPTYDRLLDRYLTGLDETHPDIQTLPTDKREAIEAEILEERHELEKLLGEDLSHTNKKFWEELKIVLDRGKSFTTRNPLDRVILKAIKAGDICPWGIDDIDNPKYINSNFYIGTEFEDVVEKNKDRGRDRMVSIKLEELLDKYELALEVGKYLGVNGISTGIPKENLDDLLSTYIESKPSNKETFLDAVGQTEEFIRLFNLFKEFKTINLVRFEDGKWVSGKAKLGKTEKEAVKNLCSNKAEMQAEKSRLIEEHKEITEKKR